MKNLHENPSYREPIIPKDDEGLGPAIHKELERRQEVGPFQNDEGAPIFTSTIDDEKNPVPETNKALEGIRIIFGKDTDDKPKK